MIAATRLQLKDVNIASTTALQALAPDGRERGLLAGANVIMPNIGEVAYRPNYKVDRAMKAGAVGTGAGLEISTTPGYLPTVPLYDTTLLEKAIDDVLAVTGGRRDPNDHDMAVGGGSTDYGDISYVLPLLQFHTGGMCGSHGSYHS